MKNYTTSVGVQQFSITIASAASTGTAIISAVGSGAFILWGGENPSTASTDSQDLAYLQLTNSTTITATRNGAASGDTIVIKGSIIDGDTSNLIKSVQQGTISFSSAQTSNTATISPVTVGNAAVHFLGHSSANISLLIDEDWCRISLSGTTVTATRSTSGASLTCAFEIIEFQGTALTANAVQQVSASSSTSVTSFTASLTNNVVMNNAISIYGGSTIASVTTSPATGLMSGALSATGTFTVSVNTGVADAKVYNASIVEFNSGVLNSAVHRSTTTLTAATSNTSALSPTVNASYAGLSWLNNTATATLADLNEAYGAGALTNGSTVTVTKNSSLTNITGSWEEFEFPAYVALSTGNSIWFGAIA